MVMLTTKQVAKRLAALLATFAENDFSTVSYYARTGESVLSLERRAADEFMVVLEELRVRAAEGRLTDYAFAVSELDEAIRLMLATQWFTEVTLENHVPWSFDADDPNVQKVLALRNELHRNAPRNLEKHGQLRLLLAA